MPRKDAVEQQTKAELALKNAQTSKEELEKAQEKLVRIEYGKTMQLAHQEWREGNVEACRNRLKDIRPVLRGWEWRYLDRICRTEQMTLKGHGDVVRFAAFGPDGSRVVTAGKDDTARLWNAKTGVELLKFSHSSLARFMPAFSLDGTRLLTASTEKTVKVWDVNSGMHVLTLQAQKLPFESALFSPDGSRIITVESSPSERIDKPVQIWDANNGTPLMHYVSKGYIRICSLSTSKENSQCVISDNGSFYLYNLKTGEKKQFGGQFGFLASLSPDGTRLVTTDFEKNIKVWDANKGYLFDLKGQTGYVSALSYSTDGNRILTASTNGSARIWDGKTGNELLTFGGHTGKLTSAEFSRDGALVLTRGVDGMAKVWDAKTGAEVVTLRGHKDGISSGGFRPMARASSPAAAMRLRGFGVPRTVSNVSDLPWSSTIFYSTQSVQD